MKSLLWFCVGLGAGAIINSSMNDYTQSGYNQYLLRPLEATYTDQISMAYTAPYLVKDEQISSIDRSLVMDMEKNVFLVQQGAIKRVEIGQLDDRTIGLVVRDNSDNELLNITGEKNFIQSANKKTFFNLLENKMQISDDNGTTLIDGGGLVSTANFTIGGKTGAGTTTTTAAWATIPDTTSLFILKRTQKILLMGGGDFYVASGDIGAGYSGYIEVAFNIDGELYPNSAVGIGAVVNYAGALSGYFHGFTSFQYLATLPAGSHTIKLVWHGVNDAATSTIGVGYPYLHYIMFGN